MCYYFIINSKNFFPPFFLKARDDKDTVLTFLHQTFFKVFSNFFWPSQVFPLKPVLSNHSFRERAFLQKRVQRYGAFSIKQIFHAFFCIFFLKSNGKKPPLLPYTIYYIRHNEKKYPRPLSSPILPCPVCKCPEFIYRFLPAGLLTSWKPTDLRRLLSEKLCFILRPAKVQNPPGIL